MHPKGQNDKKYRCVGTTGVWYAGEEVPLYLMWVDGWEVDYR